MVGVGALGSHVIQFLRNVDASICAIDFDRIEQRNTQAQFYSKAGIRKLKSNTLAQQMKLLWGVTISSLPRELSQDNVDALLGGSSLILDCLDNAAARGVIQRFVRVIGIPCLHGALAPDGTFGRVVWDENFRIDDEDVEGQATCEGGEFLPFIALTSSYLAYSAQTFLEDNKKIGFEINPNGAIIT